MVDALAILILSSIAGASVVLGGFANWRARSSYQVDLTRWLALAAAALVLTTLVLVLWPSPSRVGFRLGLFLVLGAGLFGLLALGARSVVRRSAVSASGRIVLYGLAALAVTLASLASAFVLMWGDLHFEQSEEY